MEAKSWPDLGMEAPALRVKAGHSSGQGPGCQRDQQGQPVGTGLLVWGQVASKARVYLSGKGCSKMPRAHGVLVGVSQSLAVTDDSVVCPEAWTVPAWSVEHMSARGTQGQGMKQESVSSRGCAFLLGCPALPSLLPGMPTCVCMDDVCAQGSVGRMPQPGSQAPWHPPDARAPV